MLSPLLALALLATSTDPEVVSFQDDAATLGAGRVTLTMEALVGQPPELANLELGAGLRAAADFGLTERLQVGLWAGGVVSGAMCRDGSDPAESGCFLDATAGGGLRARVGLMRIARDVLQFGLEGGTSARWVPGPTPRLGLGAQAALAASIKGGSWALVSLQAGAAGDWIPAKGEKGTTRHIFASAGLEVAPASFHPFARVTLGQLTNVLFDLSQTTLTVEGGLVFDLGQRLPAPKPG